MQQTRFLKKRNRRLITTHPEKKMYVLFWWYQIAEEDLEAGITGRSCHTVNTDEKLYHFSENKSVPPGPMKFF
jgi:hypothetical protein